MEDKIWDVIVVGAGIEGSSTAYQLAKRGTSTLLLEQFPIPHNRGSSHGQTRITRKAYGSFKHYALMMKEAFEAWSKLEKDCSVALYRETGMLCTGAPDNEFIRGTLEFSKSDGIPVDVLSKRDIEVRYPKITFPNNYTYILDQHAGILMADKALRAFQDQFKKHSGTIADNEKLIDVIPGAVITLRTSRTRRRCKSLVLTVGPWAAQLLPKLGIHIPLKPIRISVCYWKEKKPGEYDIGKFPTFYENKAIEEKYSVYGMPSLEYPGYVKMCLHWGPDINPDNRDDVDDSWVQTRIRKYMAEHFPSLHSEPSIVEPCIYTMLPDEDFVLDKHPTWSNIVIGAGFSGHGFKLAPVVGKILTQLALDETPSYDISKCRLSRFNYTKSKI